MGKREFRMPIFKHTRHDFIEATYGDLSEDAAIIAREVLTGPKKMILLERLKVLKESNGSFKDSIILEAVCQSSVTIEELVLNAFEMGKAISDMHNPLIMMAFKNHLKKQDGE